jgi:hypothetical protein
MNTYTFHVLSTGTASIDRVTVSAASILEAEELIAAARINGEKLTDPHLEHQVFA